MPKNCTVACNTFRQEFTTPSRNFVFCHDNCEVNREIVLLLQSILSGMCACMYVMASATSCWMFLSCIVAKVEPGSAFLNDDSTLFRQTPLQLKPCCAECCFITKISDQPHWSLLHDFLLSLHSGAATNLQKCMAGDRPSLASQNFRLYGRQLCRQCIAPC